jgi:predicted DNA-binding transcriptional regulator YafY
MGRNYTRIHKLLRIVQLVQSRSGLNAAALAQTLETHPRTIYRDIQALNAAGVPCAFDRETNGYRIRRGFFMPPIELTFEEAMALVAMVEQISEKSQIAFLELAGRAVEKIRSQLPPQVLEKLDPLDGRVRVDLGPGQADDAPKDFFEIVRQAIVSRRLLRCIYDPVKSEHDERDRAFDLRPYALWFSQRAWYVVGHHSARGAVRILKLNRFISVKPTDQPYHIPDDFNLQDELGLAWRMIRGKKRYRVAIRFEPPFADSASETRWHRTQEEEWNGDGSVTLRFTVDGLDEIVWWVLSSGPAAKVLEPRELIDRVRELARQICKQYPTRKKKPARVT